MCVPLLVWSGRGYSRYITLDFWCYHLDLILCMFSHIPLFYYHSFIILDLLCLYFYCFNYFLDLSYVFILLCFPLLRFYFLSFTLSLYFYTFLCAITVTGYKSISKQQIMTIYAMGYSK